MTVKTCSGCDANPERTPENFSYDKNSPDGLFHRCKICEADRVNRHYYDNQLHILDKRYQEYHDPEKHDAKKAYFADKRRAYRAKQREQALSA